MLKQKINDFRLVLVIWFMNENSGGFMKKLLTGFLSVFLLTAIVKPQKAEAAIIVGSAAGLGAGIATLVLGGTLAVTIPDHDLRGDSLSTLLFLIAIVADEEESSISNELISRFPSITNEALKATSKIIAAKLKEIDANDKGLKEVTLDSATASALTELADFESKEVALEFYNILSTKVLK